MPRSSAAVPGFQPPCFAMAAWCGVLPLTLDKLTAAITEWHIFVIVDQAKKSTVLHTVA